MARRPLSITALALLGALTAPPLAGAQERDLWATVNVCDTARQPNTVGIRASMPGNGTRQRMFMRFQVEFFTEGGEWRPVRGVGASPFVEAGSARFKRRQAGYSFQIDPPSSQERFLLRGVVAFEWRQRQGRRTVVRRRERRLTSGGHEDAQGGDPPRFSAATCEVR